MRLVIGIVSVCFIAAGIQASSAQQLSQQSTVPGGVKVCSAVVGGNWRNDIPVSRPWTAAMCATWASTIGAANHNIACLTDTGVHYDFQGGGWDTCGW